MNAVELRPAQVIDRYTLQERIGMGASGEVWRAVEGEHTVALKFINASLLTRHDAERHRQRFQMEANALENLGNLPHIPDLYGYNLGATRPYLAMTYVASRAWSDLIHSGEILHMPLKQRFALLERVAATLAQVHQRGYLHRDIKPGNIHGLDHPYILDFSVTIPRAQAVEENVGTPIYMPPPDGHPPDHRADTFAFMIVIYEMLFGFHPLFSPGYRPASLSEARETTRRKLAEDDWALPSRLTAARLPTNLTGANLPRLDSIFQQGLGPREKRYPDPQQALRDVQNAIFIPTNAAFVNVLPSVVRTPHDIPAEEDYTLHEVRKVQQRTQHPTSQTRPKRRRPSPTILITGLLVLLGTAAVLFMLFSMLFR